MEVLTARIWQWNPSVLEICMSLFHFTGISFEIDTLYYEDTFEYSSLSSLL